MNPPQPASEPYSKGDAVTVYVGEDDPDVRYHGVKCVVTDRLQDDLNTETGRDRDQYLYRIKTVNGQGSVPHKAFSAQLFLKPEFHGGAVVLVVLTRRSPTNRRRAVAVGGGCRRRDSVATPGEGYPGRGLAGKPVVWRSVCGDGPTRREGRPRCPLNHVDELLERPLPEAAPPRRGVATYSQCKYRQTFCNNKLTTTYSSRTTGFCVEVVAILCSESR